MKKITILFATCFFIITLQVNAQSFQNFIGRATPVEYGVSVGWRDDSLLWIMSNYRSGYSSATTVPVFMRLRINGTVQFARQFNLPVAGTARGAWMDDVINPGKKSIGTISAVGWWSDDSLLWVIRCNNSGNVLWARQLGNTAFSSNSSLRIKTAYNIDGSINGFYILITHFDNKGESVIKLSRSGETLWQKRITHSIAGQRFVMRDLQVTNDRGCILAGYQEGSTSSPVLFKLSSNGDVSWARSYDFFSSLYSGAFGVTVTPTGYAVTGSETSGANLTFTTNKTGGVIWANKYASAAVANMQSNGIISDSVGNLVFMGNNLSSSTPAFLVKLSAIGNVIFGRSYYSEAYMSDIKLSHNGYCAVGTSDPSNANADIYLINADLNGNISAGCNPATINITKMAPEFVNVSNASFNVVNETMVNNPSTVTTSAISTQQSRCGTSSFKIAEETTLAQTSKFSAYVDKSGHSIKFEYKTKDNGKSTYEVILYNINGMMINKKVIQPNQIESLSLGNMINGIFSAVLMKDGILISRQNIMW